MAGFVDLFLMLNFFVKFLEYLAKRNWSGTVAFVLFCIDFWLIVFSKFLRALASENFSCCIYKYIVIYTVNM